MRRLKSAPSSDEHEVKLPASAPNGDPLESKRHARAWQFGLGSKRVAPVAVPRADGLPAVVATRRSASKIRGPQPGYG